MKFQQRLGLIVMMVSALFALACGDGSLFHPLTTEGPACTTSTLCQQPATAPVCADPDTGICDKYLSTSSGGTGVCQYRIKNSSSCGCQAKTIQYCPVDPTAGAGGARQIQDCVVTGGTSASWGGCHN